MREFSTTMMNEMTKYNDPNNDAVSSVLAKVDDVKGIMVQNIDQIMQNHERVDVIVNKSENLALTSRISFFLEYKKIRILIYITI